MGRYELANLLSILGHGTEPRWVELTALNTGAVPPALTASGGAPSTAASGSALGAADPVVVAYPAVSLRVLGKSHDAAAADVAEVHRRTARLTISAFVASAEYTVGINGTSVSTTSQPYADAAAALAAIKAAIDGSGTLAALVSTELADADGDLASDTLVIRGLAEPDWYFSALSVTASGSVAVIADAAAADVAIFLAAGGVDNVANPRPPGWRLAYGDGGPVEHAIDRRGYVERLAVAGSSRLAIAVDNVAGPGSEVGGISYAYRAWVGIGEEP